MITITTKHEKGLYKAFESIKDQANDILEGISVWNTNCLETTYTLGPPSSAAEEILAQKISETESLINSFNEIKNEFAELTGVNFTSLLLRSEQNILDKVGERTAILRELIVECNKAMGILEDTVSPIPSTERKMLEPLRKELEDISAKVRDVNFEKNLEAAIEECEKGDYLASWLITGRVVRYIFEKNPGNSIDEKMKFLKDKGVVSSDKRDAINFILKTDRETRNIASHTISAFPQSRDAISLLADSIKLLDPVWVKFEGLQERR